MLHRRHVRAQSGEPLKMLVDGPQADLAPPGHGNPCLAASAQQGADKIIGSAHMPGEIMGYDVGADAAGIDIHRVFIDAAHLGAQGGQNLQRRGDVGNVRYIFNTAYAVG